MSLAAPVRPHYLAEWYRPDVTAQPVDDITERLDAGTALLCAEGTPVRLLLTLAVPADEVLYGLFSAASPDIVVQACRRAGMPLERITADVAARINSNS